MRLAGVAGKVVGRKNRAGRLNEICYRRPASGSKKCLYIVNKLRGSSSGKCRPFTARAFRRASRNVMPLF